jgi:nitrogen fixation protein NifB
MDKKTIEEKVKNHPCYCAGAHLKYSRIHLPVAPECNIQCNYCNRKYDCSNESRPGVTSGVLTPQEALEKVIVAKHSLPNLSVVGIAGPGDALANPVETFKTFELIKTYDPELKLCLSTNGLNLYKHIDDIVKAGIEHVTVTLNALTPEIARKVYAWVQEVPKQKLEGDAAMQLLIDRQLEGIKMLVENDIIVKINTVFIPEINGDHVPEITAKIKKLGAYIHNILPLLSKPEYGTKFGLDGVKEPTCKELADVREKSANVLGGFSQIMQHCKQCRADAAGILGSDEGLSDLNCESSDHFVSHVNKVMDTLVGDTDNWINSQIGTSELGDDVIKVAVASKEGILADTNFGRAKRYSIYEVTKEGVSFVESRNVNDIEYDGNDARCESGAGKLFSLLSDCSSVVYAKIGNAPKNALEEYGLFVPTNLGYEVNEKVAWIAANRFETRKVTIKG